MQSYYNLYKYLYFFTFFKLLLYSFLTSNENEIPLFDELLLKR